MFIITLSIVLRQNNGALGMKKDKTCDPKEGEELTPNKNKFNDQTKINKFLFCIPNNNNNNNNGNTTILEDLQYITEGAVSVAPMALESHRNNNDNEIDDDDLMNIIDDVVSLFYDCSYNTQA